MSWDTFFDGLLGNEQPQQPQQPQQQRAPLMASPKRGLPPINKPFDSSPQGGMPFTRPKPQNSGINPQQVMAVLKNAPPEVIKSLMGIKG